MKVILKEDVDGLGIMGAIVDVKNGFGRNYLLPRNMAVEASSKNVKEFEHQKKIIQEKAKKVVKSAEDLAAKISELSLSIEAKAGEGDKLFGSVTTKDIAEAIAAKGFEIDKKKVILEEPVKRLGTYDVSIKVHQDVVATVKLDVLNADAGDAPEAAAESPQPASEEEPKE